MANTKNITFDQLQAALNRVKSYTDGTFSQLGHTHKTSDVVSLEGFVASNEGGATEELGGMQIKVTATDTLNAALAKLDRSITNIVENIGAINVADHKHDDIYYQKSQIDDFIAELEQADTDNLDAAKGYTDTAITNLINGAPEQLNTLNELAEALGDDANFAATMTEALSQKVAGPASATVGHVAVFNASNGKEIKDSGFTIETSVPSGALFTDYKVTTAPNASADIYFAGTTNVSGETGTLAINPNIHMNGDTITAPKFAGDLDGNADTATTATTALKTQGALTLTLNDSAQTAFDGSQNVNIAITAASVGAHPADYTEKATDAEVNDMLSAIFGTE